MTTIETAAEKKVVPAEPAPAAGPELPPAVFLRPRRGWQMINFAELWHFRDLLYFLIWRDVKVRYKQTVLGVAWALLQPLLMMVVFTVLFSMVADTYHRDDDLPYPLFALAGLLPWSFFATSITQAGNSVIGSERLVTKIYFPRLAVPFASVGAAVVDFLVALPLLLILLLVYAKSPGWSILLLPVLFLMLMLAAAGIGTLLAALNVAYRDFRYVIPFMVQLWMYATPTIYFDMSSSSGGKFAWARQLLELNPMTGLIAAFRASFLDQPIPWDMLLFSGASAVLFFFAGCCYFRRVEDSFADVI
jgi:lipopolysaccharide transport system permease protein